MLCLVNMYLVVRDPHTTNALHYTNQTLRRTHARVCIKQPTALLSCQFSFSKVFCFDHMYMVLISGELFNNCCIVFIDRSWVPRWTTSCLS